MKLIALEHLRSSNPIIDLFEHLIDPYLFCLGIIRPGIP